MPQQHYPGSQRSNWVYLISKVSCSVHGKRDNQNLESMCFLAFYQYATKPGIALRTYLWVFSIIGSAAARYKPHEHGKGSSVSRSQTNGSVTFVVSSAWVLLLVVFGDCCRWVATVASKFAAVSWSNLQASVVLPFGKRPAAGVPWPARVAADAIWIVSELWFCSCTAVVDSVWGLATGMEPASYNTITW